MALSWRPDRPDFGARIHGIDVLYGEVAYEDRSLDKVNRDLYKLARYAKAVLASGNDVVLPIQVVMASSATYIPPLMLPDPEAPEIDTSVKREDAEDP